MMNTSFNIPIDFNQIFNILRQLPYNDRKELAEKLIENNDTEQKISKGKRLAKDIFKALSFDTRGFKFDRDEANSR